MTPFTATIRADRVRISGAHHNLEFPLADLDSWRGFYMRMAARKKRESYQRVLAALNGIKGEK